MTSDFLSDLEVEERLKAMNDRQLMEFTAWEVNKIYSVVGNNTKRIKVIETRFKKMTGLVGGAGTLVGGIIVALINYFTGR